jgi:assimilatory nitrate reductase electron transfer subunit
VTARPLRVVVVGNGMAGFRFVQELRDLAPGIDVTVTGEEPGGAYNRAQLPLVLAGAADEASIELADEHWYAARGVRLVTGTASGIDRARMLLEMADGSALRYDVLVLAAGSAPVVPRADGLTGADGTLAPGAVAFRTLADCTRIRDLAEAARHAVVLGGGVLGLETARGLATTGLPVTLVQRGRRLMERQLDAPAARVLAQTVRALGVCVRAGASVRQVRRSSGGRPRCPSGTGRVTGVVLDDGVTLGADLLVLCCGTRPRTELARAAGLAVSAGVVVDDHMRSVTDPAVFAIGDCAEHRGRTHGLIGPAWAQARAAARAVAALAAGTPTDPPASPNAPGQGRYPGSSVVRLKAAGIELAVLGAAHGGGRAEVIRFTDPARGVYQKLVVRDGRLAGAILLGDTRTAGTLTQLFDRAATLPADRSSLLGLARGAVAPVTSSPVAIPGHATVCQCNGVTKAAICAAWQEGARDAGQVADRTRASTGCGTCRDAVEGIVAWLAAAEPALVAT